MTTFASAISRLMSSYRCPTVGKDRLRVGLRVNISLFGRQIDDVRMPIATSTASDSTTIRVALQNGGHEQRLVDPGWLNDGIVDPSYLRSTAEPLAAIEFCNDRSLAAAAPHRV